MPWTDCPKRFSSFVSREFFPVITRRGLSSLVRGGGHRFALFFWFENCLHRHGFGSFVPDFIKLRPRHRYLSVDKSVHLFCFFHFFCFLQFTIVVVRDGSSSCGRPRVSGIDRHSACAFVPMATTGLPEIILSAFGSFPATFLLPVIKLKLSNFGVPLSKSTPNNKRSCV